MDNASTFRIYGLLGYPVKHSLSPVMQNAAFKTLPINAEYRLFEVRPEDLEEFLLSDKPAQDTEGNSVAKSDIFGFNITIPHKVKAREILEKKFPLDNKKQEVPENEYYVQLSGAINTVKRETGSLKYYNTDASGFLRSLRQDLKFETKNKNVLVIGCGGAGRAVIASLTWERREGVAKIYINDVNQEATNSAREHFSKLSRFSYLKDKLKFISSDEIPHIIKECHLLVNATPIGMKGEDASIVDKSLLHKGLFVYDLVYYKQGTTRLMKDASSLNLTCASGLEMLLYQGADAFELWMAPMQAPIEIMRKALMEAAKR
ncbi:MAG: shikimate dehydrogenase [Candidatus Omnitrophota bacterium]|nr:MAG: shikimate dehydrogenase [Candidatus Omnitrophota bacterium]